MPVADRERRVGERPHVGRGHDVQHRQARDPLRVVQRHAVGDAPPAVVAGHGEALVPEAGHRGDEVLGHRPLGVRRVARGGLGEERVAVPREVGGDDGEALGQPRGDRVPHQVGLRVAVQEQQGRSPAGDPRVDRAARRRQRGGAEVLEHAAQPRRSDVRARVGGHAADDAGRASRRSAISRGGRARRRRRRPSVRRTPSRRGGACPCAAAARGRPARRGAQSQNRTVSAVSRSTTSTWSSAVVGARNAGPRCSRVRRTAYTAAARVTVDDGHEASVDPRRGVAKARKRPPALCVRCPPTVPRRCDG